MNNPSCKMEYTKDHFEKSPLKYALSRNSYQSTTEILANFAKDDKFYVELQPEDLIELIHDSPKNLEIFFENAVCDVE